MREEIVHSIDEEREHLRNLARKITKVPQKITIPMEYMS
jgi:hypothetical protein